jgi:D-alanyl-D-alanine carboxypeptidase
LWNFDGAIGGKTGYTHAAQKCFVGAVQRNGATLLVAILGSRNLWGDTRQLLEYGFDNYETLKSAAQEISRPATSRTVTHTRRTSVTLVAQEEEAKLAPADGYILQLGAFHERERAEVLARQFSQRGLEAFLEKVTPPKGEVTYRVRLGPYGARSEAEEILTEIFQTTGHEAIIVPAEAPGELDGRPS